MVSLSQWPTRKVSFVCVLLFFGIVVRGRDISGIFIVVRERDREREKEREAMTSLSHPVEHQRVR